VRASRAICSRASAVPPPEFFEQLVLDLLHAMGYGTNRSDLQRVGGSGDGGIDGIISLDRLGLEKVYVQAKRWKNNVGSPEIQGVMGALQLQGSCAAVA
jgi:restriction system protein